MASQYHSLFTTLGLELLREAIQNGTKLGITHMSYGDGNGTLPIPDASFTKMINEVYRTQLNRLAPSKENANWLEADGIIPSAIGGFNIREVGLWAGNVMVAYANYPPTYKPSADQGTAQIKTIRIVLQIDNTANFELKIDASVVMATIQSVEDAKLYAKDYADTTKVHTVNSLNELLALEKWDGRTVTVTSIIAGENKGAGEYYYDISKKDLNDGGVFINGWVRKNVGRKVSPEWWKATGGLNNDATPAFQSACDYLNKVGGGEIVCLSELYSFTGTVKYYSNTIIDGSNASFVGGINNVIFSNALFNKDRTSSILAKEDTVYYKYQNSIAANNPWTDIASDVASNAYSIIVADASGFNIGDYVFLSNGYCDMWRVMEQYTGSSQDWVRKDVDLWRCEIARIKSITGTTIVFENQLRETYSVKPKTFGLFNDENNRDDHQGWNKPTVERLGGVSNVIFKNMKLKNGKQSIFAKLSVGVTVSNCEVSDGSEGIVYHTCFNSHMLSCIGDKKGFAFSIQRGSQFCSMSNITATHNEGDSPLIIWEGSHLCLANNIQINGRYLTNTVGHAKIGLYLNTCWDCSATNVNGKNLIDITSVQFCRGPITVNNIIGQNCDRALNIYRSFAVTSANASLNGYLTSDADISPYTGILLSISESSSTTCTNFNTHEKYKSLKESGRIHIYKSYDVNFNAVVAENTALWNSYDDDKKIELDKLKFFDSQGKYREIIVSQAFNDGENQIRTSKFIDTEIQRRVSLTNIHKNLLERVQILGKDVDSSLKLTISHYNRLINCDLTNNTVGIDFLGDGSPGNEEWCALIFLKSTRINAPTKFKNYVDPTTQISINNVSKHCRASEEVSILTNFPKVKTYVNPGQSGNRVGWYISEITDGLQMLSIDSASIQSISNGINTNNKYLGKEVFNSTLSKFMKSTGSASNSTWISSDGQTTITPN